jgi:hypothetical protein
MSDNRQGGSFRALQCGSQCGFPALVNKSVFAVAFSSFLAQRSFDKYQCADCDAVVEFRCPSFWNEDGTLRVTKATFGWPLVLI